MPTGPSPITRLTAALRRRATVLAGAALCAGVAVVVLAVVLLSGGSPGPTAAVDAASVTASGGAVRESGTVRMGVDGAPAAESTTGSPEAPPPGPSEPAVGVDPTPGSAPDSTAPGSSAPDSTTPGSSAPDSTAPGSSAPDSTAPGSSAPDSTAPGTGSAAPGSTAAGSTTPGIDAAGTGPAATGTESSAPGATGSATPGPTGPTVASVPTGSPSSSAPPAITPAPAGGSREAQVLTLVNRERAAAGCRAVTADAGLAALARAHSADMRDRGYFDHTDPDGLGPFQRADAAGLPARAENIARGQSDPAAVMASWMAGPDHRANVLDCDLTRLGVGIAEGAGGPWWTQVFG